MMLRRITVVAVLMVFLVALAGCRTTDTTPGPGPGNGGDKPPDQAVSERPAEKTITTYPEGMAETGTYLLLDRPELPFTTYVPKEGMHKDVEALAAENAKGVRVGPLEIMFFDAGVNEAQARQAFNELVDQRMAGVGLVPHDEPPAWVLATLPGVKGDRYYHAQLGEYQGRYFYMYEEALLEMGDGWAPVYKVIVEEWRWRDTGAPLE